MNNYIQFNIQFKQLPKLQNFLKDHYPNIHGTNRVTITAAGLRDLAWMPIQKPTSQTWVIIDLDGLDYSGTAYEFGKTMIDQFYDYAPTISMAAKVFDSVAPWPTDGRYQKAYSLSHSTQEQAHAGDIAIKYFWLIIFVAGLLAVIYAINMFAANAMHP